MRSYCRVAVRLSTHAMIVVIIPIFAADVTRGSQRNDHSAVLQSPHSCSFIVIPRGTSDPLQILDSDVNQRICAHALNNVFLENGLYMVNPEASYALEDRILAGELLNNRNTPGHEDSFSSQYVADVQIYFTLSLKSEGVSSNPKYTACVELECYDPAGTPLFARGTSEKASDQSITTEQAIQYAANVAGLNLLDSLFYRQSSKELSIPHIRVIIRLDDRIDIDTRGHLQNIIIETMTNHALHIKENILTKHILDCWVFFVTGEHDHNRWLREIIDLLSSRFPTLEFRIVLEQNDLFLLKVTNNEK